MNKTVTAPCTFAVVSMLGKLIRVEFGEIKGYGRITGMMNDGDSELATVEMEKFDEID